MSSVNSTYNDTAYQAALLSDGDVVVVGQANNSIAWGGSCNAPGTEADRVFGFITRLDGSSHTCESTYRLSTDNTGDDVNLFGQFRHVVTRGDAVYLYGHYRAWGATPLIEANDGTDLITLVDGQEDNNAVVIRMSPGEIFTSVAEFRDVDTGSQNQFAKALAVDSAGAVIAATTFLNVFYPRGASGPDYLQGPGNSTSSALIKLSGDKGNTVDAPNQVAWAKGFIASSDGSTPCTISALATDSADNVYVAGQFKGAQATLGDLAVPASATGTSSDVFVAKYSADGTHVWTQRHGGSGDDTVTAMAVTPEDDLVLVGIARSDDLDFGTGTPLDISLSYNGYSWKVAGRDGSTIWADPFTGVAGSGRKVYAYGVAVSASGEIYISGTFDEDWPEPPPDASALSAYGVSEIFVFKYVGPTP
jgi:hypothetical protein